MTTITFDNHRKSTITIENIGNDVSFLMNPVLDNSNGWIKFIEDLTRH